ncbi:MAG: hypothetical protein D6775_09805, partial [Caldilineae bacterium]
SALPSPRPDPYFEPTLRRSIINYEQGRAWRRPSPAAAQSRVSAMTLGQVRIHIDREGLYAITYQDLVDAGANLSKLDARTLSLSSRGQEVAIWVEGEADGRFDPGDRILFYGQGSDSRYSRERVYWLSWGTAPGRRMTTRDVNPGLGGTPVTTYMARVQFEENDYYISSLPATGQADRWYWQRYNVGTRPNIPTLSLDAPLANPLASGQAELRVVLRGSTTYFNISPDHRVRLSINGTQIGTGEWDGQAELDATYPFSASLLADGNNILRITATNDTGAPSDSAYLNRFELRYPRSLMAQDGHLIFEHTFAGRARFQVAGFGTSPLMGLDVTQAEEPVRLLNGQVQDSAYLFSDNAAGTARYLIWPEAEPLRPQRIVGDTFSNLHSAGNRADYLIITHADFRDAIEPLAQYRRSQGYEVLVIDVQDIYDEFNNGELSPEAIRDFLDYAYHYWQAPAPAYVLLVGDGTYDYLNYLGGQHRNWIPPYLDVVDPFIRETATDNRLVTVSGSDILPDLFIGRFPANSVAEVTTLVNKTINYEQSPPPGDWAMRNVFIADNADIAGDFAALSDKVADQLVPDLYTPYRQKIYLGVNYSSPINARNAIIAAFNQGALITNYIGHGQVQHWASEFLFRATDAAALGNGGRLPVQLSMTCLDGRFHEVASDALAEELVRNAGGGAVASWAATGLGVAHGHDYMHQGFYRTLFEQGERTLGPLTTAGKIALYTGDTNGVFHDLIDTFGLLGDPALRLALATNDVSITLEEAPAMPLAQGDDVVLRFGLLNTGPMAAPEVVVSAGLPPLQNLEATSDLGPVQIGAGLPVSFTLGTLGAGQSATLTVTGTLPAALPQNRYLITATVTSGWPDGDLTNNETMPRWLELAAADASVGLVAASTQALAAGDLFSAMVKFTNVGPGDATGVAITLPLPSAIQALSWTSTDPATTQQSSYPLVFHLPSLPVGAAGAITVDGVAGNTALRTQVQATLHSDWPDDNLTNNTSQPITILIAGDDPLEPNDLATTAASLSVPADLPDLSYSRAGEQDWFLFSAQAGSSYLFYTDNLSKGGQTMLLIYDAKGVEMARSLGDASGTRLLWQAPASGQYYVVVTRPGAGDTVFLYDLHSRYGLHVFLPSQRRSR